MDEMPREIPPWKQEQFKTLKEAKLCRDGLLNNTACYGVHVYHGHRHWVVKWKEVEL